MKFFVTGVNGQLGHDVMNELHKRGHEGVGSDIALAYAGVADGSAVTTMPYVGLDITDKEAVKKVIAEVKPDAVIHCAAWTAVDMAEDDDKVEKVRAVNAGGTQNIADACKAIDCKMLYLSTDYVFDGQGTEPWQPDCKDYKPLNVYGQTKLEGELAVANTLEKYFIHGNMIVFGGSEVDRDKVVKPNGNYKTLSYCLGSVIHPGSFVRKSAYERYGLFDVHYKSCMDRDLILRMYRSGAKFQYVDKELVRVRRGGVSFTGIKLSLDEGREISLKNGTSPIVANGYYIYHYCKIQLNCDVRMVLAVGHPKTKSEPRQKVRKPFDEVCSFNQW